MFKLGSPLLLACALLAPAALALAAAPEQKVALIVGNSAYPASALRNPVNDATAMAAKLRSLGFDVLLKTDLTQREMTRAVTQFGQKLQPGAVGLFYYAGHGVQVQGKNFLIPVDAEIQNETSVRSEAVDVDLVLHQLGPARLSMVILDACRNNPFERKFRGAGGGLAQIEAPTGTLIAYATAPGKTADDGASGNGLYTTELLKTIDRPGLPVEEVFKQVRINVLKASSNQQIPWEASSLTGEFFFRAAASAKTDLTLAAVESERAALAKSIEEERRKRESEAETMKREMETLRADMARMREALARPAPTQPAAQAPVAKPVEAPAVPPPIARKEPPASNPAISAASKPEGTPPQQLALAPATSSATLPLADSWQQRIFLVESSKGKLTYARAMATLLDIEKEEDLAELLKSEGFLKRQPWSNAYAIGINANGFIVQGRAFNERNPEFAAEMALTGCRRRERGNTCRVVMIDSEWQDAPFLAIARLLAEGRNNVPAVRRVYLVNLPRDTGFR